MSKVISVYVDEETQLLFKRALAIMAQQAGVESISASVVLRKVINDIIANPTPPFDQGWVEGYKAAYGRVMHVVQRTLAELLHTPPDVRRGIGIGAVLPDGAMVGDEE